MIAHNSKHPAKPFIDRVVALEEQRRALAADIKEVWAEAKEDCLDRFGDDPERVKQELAAMRLVVKRDPRLESDGKRKRREAVEETRDEILAALGMLAGTPLGEAAAGGR